MINILDKYSAYVTVGGVKPGRSWSSANQIGRALADRQILDAGNQRRSATSRGPASVIVIILDAAISEQIVVDVPPPGPAALARALTARPAAAAPDNVGEQANGGEARDSANHAHQLGQIQAANFLVACNNSNSIKDY